MERYQSKKRRKVKGVRYIFTSGLSFLPEPRIAKVPKRIALIIVCASTHQLEIWADCVTAVPMCVRGKENVCRYGLYLDRWDLFDQNEYLYKDLNILWMCCYQRSRTAALFKKQKTIIPLDETVSHLIVENTKITTIELCNQLECPMIPTHVKVIHSSWSMES